MILMIISCTFNSQHELRHGLIILGLRKLRDISTPVPKVKDCALVRICGAILIICVSNRRNHKEVGKRSISHWLLFGRKLIYQEKNKSIRVLQKHKNSLETFPYSNQKHLGMYRSVTLTLHMPIDKFLMLSQHNNKATGV